jgi:hypothetical protein
MTTRWRVDFWRGAEAMDRAREGSASGIEDGIEHIARVANEHTPIDTGRLRASQKTSIDGLDAKIEYMADYAIYVHEVGPNSGGRHGTGYTHAPPTGFKFLENATNSEQRITLAMLAKELRQKF